MGGEMTEQDVLDGRVFADKIITLTMGMRNPTAIAGIATAFAGATLLARCGPRAALLLYLHFPDELVTKQELRLGSAEPQWLQARREARAIAAIVRTCEL